MSSSASKATSALTALSQELAAAIAQAAPAVVAVNARRFPASGVHWGQGLIITADHTIRREEEITVTLPDRQITPATLVGRDAATRLAVLKLNSGEIPTAEIGDAAELKVGHIVLAIARSSEVGLSASWGIISAY